MSKDVTQTNAVRLTESYQSECLSSDPRRSWRYLADLLHTLNPRAFSQGLWDNTLHDSYNGCADNKNLTSFISCFL